MYNVGQDYIDALAEKTRSDRIYGTLRLADGSTTEITDENLVRDSLSLSKELCGEQYRVGTFNTACLKLSFFIENALGIDLTDSSVEISYFLSVGGGSEQQVPLGTFYVDPILSVRRKNILNIVAFDAGVRFDRDISENFRRIAATPAQLISAACSYCAVGCNVQQDSFADMPNGTLTVSASDRQIQTYRDVIMWCASLVCGYAVIGRDSRLSVIPAIYGVSGGSIVTGRTVTAAERQSIYVTDTRAYIKYLTAYAGDNVACYVSSFSAQDEQAAPAAYVLEKNPLLADKTETECETANEDWLAYIDNFMQRGVQARIMGDPALDTGDALLFTGGDVDQRTGIIGVVTSYEWRYRKYHDIRCSAAECCGSIAPDSAPGGASSVRTQTAKRIDAIKTGGVGEDLGNRNENFNTYTGNSRANRIVGTGGGCNHLEGELNTLQGCGYTSVGGANNSGTNDNYSIVHGNYNTFSGSGHMIAGSQNNVSGAYNAVAGYSNTVTGNHSVVAGCGNTVGASYALVCGYGVNASGPAAGYVFYAGSNNISVTMTSNGYVTATAYNTSGADYAEYFEWADGNPDDEDRRGMLVSIVGDCIQPADGPDIDGIVSAAPAVCGNSFDLNWQGRYKKDIFGTVQIGENGEQEVSDSYDRNLGYIPRSKRKEWSPVGLVGRLVITDDGSCTAGGYVTAVNGIGCAADGITRVKVLKRLDDTHVEVLIR